MPKISIIVPVYNTEKYLRPCLDSILAQKFTDWETILVDDGSKDQSGQICDEYVNKAPRFTVIHNENHGVSVTRNIGIKNANAEWLYFIDADDELLPDALENLYRNTSEEVDLVSASYVRYEENKIIPERQASVDALLTREQFIKEISYYKARNCERYCWTKLFRRSVIQNNNLSFDTTLAYREDVVFLYSYLIHCSRQIKCVKAPVYNYYRRSEGAAMTYVAKYSPKSKGIFLSIERCLNMVKGDVKLKEAKEGLKSELINAYFQLRVLIYNSGNSELKKEKRDLWKRLTKHIGFKRALIIQIKEFLRPTYHKIKMILFMGKK